MRELVWCISNSGANFRLDTTAQNAQRRLVAGVRANFPLAVEPTRRCRKHVKVINNNHAHFLRRMLFGSSGQALSRQVRVMKCYRHMSLDTRQLQRRTLLYRYRLAPARTNPSSFRHLLRPLHRIQLMSSQTPQVLSTEPLNTTDAKCVRKTLPARAQFRSFSRRFFLKGGSA